MFTVTVATSPGASVTCAGETPPRPIGRQIDPAGAHVDRGGLRQRIAELNRCVGIADLSQSIACNSGHCRCLQQTGAAAHTETGREGIRMQQRIAQVAADEGFIGIHV